MKKLLTMFLMLMVLVGMVIPASATFVDEKWRANQISVEEDKHQAAAKATKLLSKRADKLERRVEVKEDLETCSADDDCDTTVEKIREFVQEKKEYLSRLTQPETQVKIKTAKVVTTKAKVLADQETFEKNKQIILAKKADIKECRTNPEGDDCAQIIEEGNELYKEYIKSGINVFIAYFENMEQEVLDADISEDVKDDMLDQINDILDKLDTLAEDVDAAESRDDVKQIRIDVADFWKSVKEQLKLNMNRYINAQPKCFDTDGSDYYTAGTIYYSGFKKSSDVCIGNRLSEAVCEGNTDGREYIDCPYGCEDGKCLPPIAVVDEPTCSDSDGGNNIYEKGILKAYTPTYGNVVVYEYCTDADGAYLAEGDYVEELVCLSDDPVYAYEHERVECPYGCADGACRSVPVLVALPVEVVEEEPQTIEYIPPEATQESEPQTIEYIPPEATQESEPQTVEYIPPEATQDTPAAVPVTVLPPIEVEPVEVTVLLPNNCVDKDGSDYYSARYIEYGNGKRGYDVCLSEDRLSEAVCKDGSDWREYYTCPYGCEDGACLPPPVYVEPTTECVDADGQDYYTASYITYAEDRRQGFDVCLSEDRLSEAVCNDGSDWREYYTCPYGCEDGACIESEYIAEYIPPEATVEYIPPETTQGTIPEAVEYIPPEAAEETPSVDPMPVETYEPETPEIVPIF